MLVCTFKLFHQVFHFVCGLLQQCMILAAICVHTCLQTGCMAADELQLLLLLLQPRLLLSIALLCCGQLCCQLLVLSCQKCLTGGLQGGQCRQIGTRVHAHLQSCAHLLAQLPLHSADMLHSHSANAATCSQDQTWPHGPDMATCTRHALICVDSLHSVLGCSVSQDDTRDCHCRHPYHSHKQSITCTAAATLHAALPSAVTVTRVLLQARPLLGTL